MNKEQVYQPQLPGLEDALPPRWPKIARRIIFAGLLAWNAHTCAGFVEAVQQEDRTELATPELEPINNPISLEVPALDSEVAGNYEDSLVSITVRPREGSGLVSKSCTGTFIEDGMILTAAHCTRRLEDDQGREFKVIDEDGKDVREEISITQRYIVRDYFLFKPSGEYFFPEYDEGYEADDAEIIRTRTQDSFGFGIHSPLAEHDPRTGDAVYLYSRYYGEEDERMYGGRVLGEEQHENQRISAIFALENTNGVCIPGTSGTGIINSKGEVVGVLTNRSEPFRVDENILDRFKLDEADLGKDVVICQMVPASHAKKLLP